MKQSSIVEADAGDFHFELHKKNDGTFECTRALLDDPTRLPEVVTEMNSIPKTVLDVFNKAM